MFASYAAARSRPLPRYAAPLLVGVVAAHLLALTGIWVKGMWDMTKLDTQREPLDLAVASPPPASPPPPAGGARPVTPSIVPARHVAKEPTQPTVHIEQAPVTPTQAATTGAGDADGKPGGEVNGTGDSLCTGGCDPDGVQTPAPPPIPVIEPPKAARVLPPTAFEAQRVSGNAQIAPDDPTKTEIQRAGQDKLIATFKLCVDASGAVAKVQQLKASGFAAYDAKIDRQMRTWRYRPFMVDGTAAPVCTAVTFIYVQR